MFDKAFGERGDTDGCEKSVEFCGRSEGGRRKGRKGREEVGGRRGRERARR
jgi:hypothetical protein